MFALDWLGLVETRLFQALAGGAAVALAGPAQRLFHRLDGVTRLRRLARRERVYEASQSAYPMAGSPLEQPPLGPLDCLLLNLLWVAPCSWLVVRFPAIAGWCVLAAWGPILAVAQAAGSARKET